jgi:hypothetical protein
MRTAFMHVWSSSRRNGRVRFPRQHRIPYPLNGQVVREADGYQGHLVSPEFGLRRLIEDAMLLVLDPVVTAVHRVHLLLVEAARWMAY